MYITNTQLKETITVIHRNLKEMRENVNKLKGEKWSDNLSGTHILLLEEDEIQGVKERYHDVEIHPARQNSHFYGKPYVYVTEHERELPLE